MPSSYLTQNQRHFQYKDASTPNSLTTRVASGKHELQRLEGRKSSEVIDIMTVVIDIYLANLGNSNSVCMICQLIFEKYLYLKPQNTKVWKKKKYTWYLPSFSQTSGKYRVESRCSLLISISNHYFNTVMSLEIFFINFLSFNCFLQIDACLHMCVNL
ncbi:hypothetical protein FF38_02740 [Lucilia cuprina]|uniref:Uncharacterized protein n=1 Tax=Lucilia cuprina TaxID=7375 RepID=A0A0L0CQF2_LUCCU|nr:hypothetical protein FF38_02740 [Lucilia cuprina]